MRKILALASALLLIGCGGSEAPEGSEEAAPAGRAELAEVDPEDPATIECAVDGAQQFARGCRVEQESAQEGTILTIRKPDGGFRRLVATRDGRGVVAADGAEPAAVTVTGDNRIEVSIGNDRFRLPATVRAGAQQGQ